MEKRQIIALGGGGFSMEPDNPKLDDYILNQCHEALPKICFLGTASGDSEGYIKRFYNSFEKRGCLPSHLSLFKGHTAQIEAFLLNQDIIYVGGGNTRNMLVLWREWGVDSILKNAYHKGIILSGISAGAICWFEQGLTDSIPNQLSNLACLGFLKGSNCPHFDGEPYRQEIYKEKIRSGEMLEGLACDDGVGLHFVDEHLEKVVSSRSEGAAYLFSVNKGELIEERLEPTRL